MPTPAPDSAEARAHDLLGVGFLLGDGSRALHVNAAAARILGRSVEELLELPQEQLGAVLGAGPPQTVLLAPPGREQIPAVGDGTLREPGRYLVMCSIPTGVDPAEYLAAAAAAGGEQPQVPGGTPHFVHGMAAELFVE